MQPFIITDAHNDYRAVPCQFFPQCRALINESHNFYCCLFRYPFFRLHTHGNLQSFFFSLLQKGKYFFFKTAAVQIVPNPVNQDNPLFSTGYIFHIMIFGIAISAIVIPIIIQYNDRNFQQIIFSFLLHHAS